MNKHDLVQQEEDISSRSSITSVAGPTRDHMAATITTSSSSSTSSSILWNKLVLSILITETAERVAYFGFRAVLVLYFTHGLQFSESTSVALCAATVALAYLSPLVGAILADSHWGRFQTIWRFGVMYAIGLLCLTMAAYRVPNYQVGDTLTEGGNVGAMEASESHVTSSVMSLARVLTFVGLFLVCIGTGGIKPCVSAFGADQVVMDNADYNGGEGTSLYSKKKLEDDLVDEHVDDASEEEVARSKLKEERLREFFNSFYFSINVGALGSFAIIPVVRAHFGFGASFLIPTISMIMALCVFRAYKNQYRHRKRNDLQPSLLEVFQVSLQIVKTRFWNRNGADHVMVPTTETNESDNDYNESESTTPQVYRDAAQALHILPLLAFFPIFWMLYDQQGSVWTLQATKMNLYGLEPEQLQFLNPLEIMIFIPLFDRKIYPWLESQGFNIQPLRRMEYGMFLTAVSFVMSTLLELRIQNQDAMSVSVLWQVPQITVITIAEILLNVTGLEFAYSQAPADMQALILALFLFTTTIGDGLAAILYGSIFSHLSSATAMLLCAIFMLINTVFFARFARKWKPYNQEPDDGQILELGPVHNMEHQH